MKEYRITNRITKEIRVVWADNAQDACQSLGWYIADCYVEILLS